MLFIGYLDLSPGWLALGLSHCSLKFSTQRRHDEIITSSIGEG
jgi:hypothetical protein